MKTALLFFGQPRFIGDNQIWNSIYDNIIEPYAPDIYAHMWYKPGSYDYGISSWASEKGTQKTSVPSFAPAIFYDRYNPTKVLIETPRFFPMTEVTGDLYDKRFLGQSEFYSRENMSNIQSQLFSIEKVCNLVEEEYDWFFLIRYDGLVRGIPDLKKEHSNDQIFIPSGGDFNDLIQIFGQRDLWVMQRLYQEFDTPYMIPKIIQKGLPIPEYFKYFAYTRYRSLNKIKRLSDLYADIRRV